MCVCFFFYRCGGWVGGEFNKFIVPKTFIVPNTYRPFQLRTMLHSDAFLQNSETCRQTHTIHQYQVCKI